MGHVCTHDHFPGPNNEHPVVAVIAIIAILAAILLIAWARLEVHGTEDLEEALSEAQQTVDAFRNEVMSRLENDAAAKSAELEAH